MVSIQEGKGQSIIIIISKIRASNLVGTAMLYTSVGGGGGGLQSSNLILKSKSKKERRYGKGTRVKSVSSPILIYVGGLSCEAII